jgi:hypothetical protein
MFVSCSREKIGKDELELETSQIDAVDCEEERSRAEDVG